MRLARHHQMMKMCRGAPSAIFKIDAYDERFLSSSVVTFGVEKFAGGIRRIFKIDAYDERFLTSSVVTCGVEILSAYIAKFSR